MITIRDVQFIYYEDNIPVNLPGGHIDDHVLLVQMEDDKIINLYTTKDEDNPDNWHSIDLAKVHPCYLDFLYSEVYLMGQLKIKKLNKETLDYMFSIGRICQEFYDECSNPV